MTPQTIDTITYNNLTTNAQRASQDINGTLRSGYVLDGIFYYVGSYGETCKGVAVDRETVVYVN